MFDGQRHFAKAIYVSKRIPSIHNTELLFFNAEIIFKNKP